MIVKICKKHGELTKEQTTKEKNLQMKSGYQIRCRQCRLDKDIKWKLNNLDKSRASASRSRNEARRLYREGLTDIEPRANILAREDRKKNPEKHAEWSRRVREKQGQLRNTKEVCRRLDVSVDYYYKLLEEQGNICKICKQQETRKARTQGKICALAIDHCHYCEDNGHEGTEIVRGLLCHDCNTAIGKFKDNITLLQSAIDYLKSHTHL